MFGCVFDSMAFCRRTIRLRLAATDRRSTHKNIVEAATVVVRHYHATHVSIAFCQFFVGWFSFVGKLLKNWNYVIRDGNEWKVNNVAADYY